MSVTKQHQHGTNRDPAPEEICSSVDLDAVAEILRRAHPELDAEDIIARILEVLEKRGP